MPKQCNKLSTKAETNIVESDEWNDFLKKNNPNQQAQICKSISNCHFGTYPTLSEIDAKWGRGHAAAWIIPQLANLSEFCGCKGKITPQQIKECAQIIANDYYYLKISEVMLFIWKFKRGDYGEFYGAVDPLKIMASMKNFIGERAERIFKHESELCKMKREEERRNAISYSQYLAMKK